jgi:hypothetical protein
MAGVRIWDAKAENAAEKEVHLAVVQALKVSTVLLPMYLQ